MSILNLLVTLLLSFCCVFSEEVGEVRKLLIQRSKSDCEFYFLTDNILLYLIELTIAHVPSSIFEAAL